jgi:hypothetical protein
MAKKKPAKKKAAKKAGSGGGSVPPRNNRGPSAGGDSPERHPLDLHQIILDDIISGSRAVGQCFTVAYIADRNRISTSTVYNHIRNMHRDGLPVYKTPRGLVFGEHVSLEDMAKTQLRMVNRINSVAIESNGVTPPTIIAWNNSNHPDRVVMVDIARRIASHQHTAWTRTSHEMFNIVDTF